MITMYGCVSYPFFLQIFLIFFIKLHEGIIVYFSMAFSNFLSWTHISRFL